jgi:hypothetical protein
MKELLEVIKELHKVIKKLHKGRSSQLGNRLKIIEKAKKRRKNHG